MNNPTLFDKSLAGGIDFPEIDSYQYETWYPTSGLSDLSEYKTVRFNMAQTSLLLHWRWAYLTIKGKISVKPDDGGAERALAAADKISLIHNFVPYLFSNCKLTVGNTLIEDVAHPGTVSTVLFNLLHDRSLSKSSGLDYFFVPDTTNEADKDKNKGWEIRRQWLLAAETNGEFVVNFPLYMLFGAFENFYALSAYPIEIELVRSHDNRLFFKAPKAQAAYKGVIKFESFTIKVPIVKPSKPESLRLLKGISDGKPYIYSFRRRNAVMAPITKDVTDYQLVVCTELFAERPKMLFLVLQACKDDNNQEFNHAAFSHHDVENAFVRVNNHQFPTVIQGAKFKQNDFGSFYLDLLHCRANYLMHPADGNCIITPPLFKTVYPVISFDLTKSDETIASKGVTVEIHLHFRTAAPADLRVYAVWWSDRTLEVYPDGKPLSIKRDTSTYI